MRQSPAVQRQAAPRNGDWSLLLVNPAFLVQFTFCVGYLIWYFVSSKTPTMLGITPRHDTPNAQFLFFSIWSGFFLGMLMVARFRVSKSNTTGLTDTEWLAVGLVSAAITFAGEAFFLRSVLANPAALLSGDLADTLSVIGSQVRNDQVLGISSLNNLFPIPASIAAMLIFTRRQLPKQARFQAGALLFAMGAMTLVHAVLASSRIWFLSFLLSCFVAWVVQRRKPLKVQMAYILAIVTLGLIFVISTELIRSLGVQLAAAGIRITDPGVVAYALTRLLQAYPASDVNNAMIVLDCPSPQQIISTFDVAARVSGSLLGSQFQYYGFCPGWTSWFGTINFMALMWWDWGYFAPVITFLIGALVQTIYMKSIEIQDHLSFAAVLLPVTLFSALHLTRSFALGQTLFMLPMLFILAIWITSWIGGRVSGPTN